MGTTRVSEEELASRIDKPHKVSRYDFASKAEVKAFVDNKLEAVTDVIDKEIDGVQQKIEKGSRRDRALAKRSGRQRQAIEKLEARVAELELTTWQRIKRGFIGFIEDVWFALSSLEDPTVILPFGSQESLDASDAAAFAIEDLEQRPAYLDGNCPDCKQEVGIVIQRKGDGSLAHVVMFDMAGDNVQPHVCPGTTAPRYEGPEFTPANYQATEDPELTRAVNEVYPPLANPEE